MIQRLPSLFCLVILVALTGCRWVEAPVEARADHGDDRHASEWLETHRNEPPMVRAFVQRMPKGADLHNHLSGSVYAEAYVRWGAAADYSLDPETNALVPPSAHAPGMKRLREVLEDAEAYGKLVDDLSTRNLAYAGQSGHDQFFETFGEFGAVSGGHVDDMIVLLADNAARENVLYVELMVLIQSSLLNTALAQGVTGLKEALGTGQGDASVAEPDFARAYQRLEEGGLAQWTEEGLANLEAAHRSYSSQLDRGRPGREVHLRFLQQSVRVMAPDQVFAQLAFAFALADRDPRMLGINLVAPEDDRIALRDYSLHMQMVRYLGQRHPDVKVALHAGELTLGLVPPGDLGFHIREAVEVAGARRIGHGVDIFLEDRPFELLERMRKERVAVEICLTSNDVILGVQGRNHPFLHYREAGVPTVLASDDAGVSRIDLSNEYLRAVLDYGLSYAELKELSRNSLEYSFLPGPSLWASTSPFTMVEDCAGDVPGGESVSPECRKFLDASERATQQWRLEAAFLEFERLPWLQPSPR